MNPDQIRSNGQKHKIFDGIENKSTRFQIQYFSKHFKTTHQTNFQNTKFRRNISRKRKRFDKKTRKQFFDPAKTSRNRKNEKLTSWEHFIKAQEFRAENLIKARLYKK